MKKTMKIWATAIVLLLMGSWSSQVSAQLITLKVNGVDRTYLEYVPKNLGAKRPLLISCHGMNQDAAYQKGMLSIESIADTAKFVVVFPNGIDKSWDIGGDRDINYVKALIDEMVRKHDIDRNSVYLSGFSMGGMFTYHAMNKIPDLIAAFAPISGYPMGGTTANSNVRPIPIIHTHGTGDDVVAFSGVQGALNAWISHNHCNSTPKVTKNYRGSSHGTLSVWSGGDEDVEVRLLELKDKGHWISNDAPIHTGREIWLFCKNYSFNKTSPKVSITTPKSGTSYNFFVPDGEIDYPTFQIRATATDPNGTIEKVDFYDGNTLIATCDAKPYQVSWTPSTPGKRDVRVVATDNDGETGEAKVEVTINNPSIVALSQSFTTGGSVPIGWVVYDGKEKRYGYSDGYTSGCRILEFTGSRHDFARALYIRNASGGAKKGYAKYGVAQTNASLTLAPGRYALKFRVCNWNRPEFAPITFAIEPSAGGDAVTEVTYTPTVNIGNNVENNFNGTILQVHEFGIKEKGNYLVAVYTGDTAWDDCIIGQLYLQVKEFGTTDIESLSADDSPVKQQRSGWYDLTGRRMAHPESLPSGIYIFDGKKVVIP